MRLIVNTKSLLLLPLLGSFFFINTTQNWTQFNVPFALNDTLIEPQKRLPENAVKNLTITEGLEAQLFASEPVMTNPTNIDVDERGRVWVCEAHNFHPEIKGNLAKKEGDRILILEDTNSDGKADKNTVFYQGPELEAPLGIWVMGNQAIVSQSSYVWLFTDDDGDDKADRKEILLQGIGSTQLGRKMCGFTFGPDGKYYFNFGNEGQTLKDKNNKVLKDKNGNDISLKNYRMGIVFRCNPDMSDVEVLGNNFCNNYEVAVDSYGAMWQSDKGDEDNKLGRINYVMDYGNFGYTDEMTGAGWQANRTHIEADIQQRRWHLNDPGVVPNLLQTGAGSPTGMCVYEGDLLPPVFRNQIIHCDAGLNTVRAYTVEKNGAGYTAKIVNIMEGKNDPWFRPSDVCVAPDGSLMVSDMYGSVVGEHQSGGSNLGRIFRISQPNMLYEIPKYDFSTVEGAILALQNPNLSVRWHAWQVLHKISESDNTALMKLYLETPNPRLKARAFWLLAKSKTGEKMIEMAASDNNPDIKIAALRAARQGNYDLSHLIKTLYDDPDPQVRRECMIALRHSKSPEYFQLMTHLALQYDGKDRWYLEAMGIGADQQWDVFLTRLFSNDNKNKLPKDARADIIWRSRGEQSATLLGELAGDNSVPIADRLRYFRAFDFIKSKNKSAVLMSIIRQNNVATKTIALRHLDPDFVTNNAEVRKILRENIKQ